MTELNNISNNRFFDIDLTKYNNDIDDIICLRKHRSTKAEVGMIKDIEEYREVKERDKVVKVIDNHNYYVEEDYSYYINLEKQADCGFRGKVNHFCDRISEMLH